MTDTLRFPGPAKENDTFLGDTSYTSSIFSPHYSLSQSLYTFHLFPWFLLAAPPITEHSPSPYKVFWSDVSSLLSFSSFSQPELKLFIAGCSSPLHNCDIYFLVYCWMGEIITESLAMSKNTFSIGYLISPLVMASYIMGCPGHYTPNNNRRGHADNNGSQLRLTSGIITNHSLYLHMRMMSNSGARDVTWRHEASLHNIIMINKCCRFLPVGIDPCVETCFYLVQYGI